MNEPKDEGPRAAEATRDDSKAHDAKPARGAKPTDDSQPVELRLRGIVKRFGEATVLAGIDLEVKRGEMLAIIGGSGSGKTVLVQVMIGHHRPEEGEVLAVDHGAPDEPLVDLAKASAAELDRIRTYWAVVFQKNALFSASVYENIAIWLREVRGIEEDEIQRRATEALTAVGFEADATLLEKERNQLSGGMAKRVALARALAMESAVMFYDEPTTGLDPTLTKQVHELIRTTHETPVDGITRTTVIVTHDKDLLYRLRPRVVMLDKGNIHFDGDYEEFSRSDSEIIRPYFELMPSLHDESTPRSRPEQDEAAGAT